MKNSSVFNCNILEFNQINNRAGNITIVEANKSLPFSLERIYYLYDIPSNEDRGAHGHKALYQLVLAASGSFTITLDDGSSKRSFLLNHPNKGLLIIPGIWRELHDFSSGAVCLVLASMPYDENDYIRDYETFKKYKHDTFSF